MQGTTSLDRWGSLNILHDSTSRFLIFNSILLKVNSFFFQSYWCQNYIHLKKISKFPVLKYRLYLDRYKDKSDIVVQFKFTLQTIWKCPGDHVKKLSKVFKTGSKRISVKWYFISVNFSVLEKDISNEGSRAICGVVISVFVCLLKNSTKSD